MYGCKTTLCLIMEQAVEMMLATSLKCILVTALLLVFTAGASQFGLAQTKVEADKPDIPKPTISTLPPAYEPQMMRLAEILGALHYLRELCGADEEQLWREQMAKILINEEPSEPRKARLIASFNKGFRGFREIYRECTPTAVTATNQYLKQGARISTEIPDRYGR